MTNPHSRPWRVVVIDDDEAVRTLIEAMIATDDRFTIVGAASDGMEGVSVATRLQPDVVLLDLEMPIMDGLAALKQLPARVPAARIIVFSAFPDAYTFVDVISRGAHAYLDKATAWVELLPVMVAACSDHADLAQNSSASA